MGDTGLGTQPPEDSAPPPGVELHETVVAGDTTVAAAKTGHAGPPLPVAGERLGPYLLLHELAEGGMGVVYRAYDPRLRRSVALKLVRPELAPEVRRRFVEEAQVTAQLQHPVIIPVHEVGESEGRVYYTMPLVQGRAFDEVLRESGPGERFQLLQVFATVCRAVAFAHERGVLHRDLKPQNVMVGVHGQVYVLDWGLAMLIDPPSPQDGEEPRVPLSERDTRRLERVYLPPELRAEQQGEVVGTPVYMAPEQADGDLKLLGPAADVYCLGGILYQILTGQPPRGGTLSEVIRGLTQGYPIPSARSLNPTVSPALDRLCAAALEPDPARRLARAQALADGVEAYLEGRDLSQAEGEDQEFLAGYRAHDFRRPSVTVDVALVRGGPAEGYEVALYQRQRPPQEGTWALPGSFVALEEDLIEAAGRVLRERLGSPATTLLEQVRTFGSPGRDPRTRVITVLYLARLKRPGERPALPEHTAWVPLAGAVAACPGGLAFDHERLLACVRGLLGRAC